MSSRYTVSISLSILTQDCRHCRSLSPLFACRCRLLSLAKTQELKEHTTLMQRRYSCCTDLEFSHEEMDLVLDDWAVVEQPLVDNPRIYTTKEGEESVVCMHQTTIYLNTERNQPVRMASVAIFWVQLIGQSASLAAAQCACVVVTDFGGKIAVSTLRRWSERKHPTQHQLPREKVRQYISRTTPFCT